MSDTKSDAPATGAPDTEAGETPALPGDGLRESIVDDLRRRIGDGLVEFVLKPQDDLWIRIAADRWRAAGEALRAMGFEYFCYLSAIDWKPSPFGRGEDDPTQPPPERKTEIVQGLAGGETRFQVLGRVTDIKRHVGVTLKVDVAGGPDDADGAEGALAIDSWHAVYAGANWHEREIHEMYGIGFNGHPDLRNMYLPTDFEGYPLRKDFPLLARLVKPWPGIVDVEPMPAEPAAPDEAPAADAAAPADATPTEGTGSATGEPTNAEPTSDAPPAAETDALPAEAAAAPSEPAADAPPAAETAEPAAEVAPEAPTESDVTEPAPAAAGAPTEGDGPGAELLEAPEAEPVPPADEVEATADALADEARAADAAVTSATDDQPGTATGEVGAPADAGGEAEPIEPGTPSADDPTDSASTDDAGPDSDAAKHPEAASDPGGATEETEADAPDHADPDEVSEARAAAASEPSADPNAAAQPATDAVANPSPDAESAPDTVGDDPKPDTDEPGSAS